MTAHSDRIRALVAHEPPVVSLLPDREATTAEFDAVYDTYRTHGAWPAMQRFLTATGIAPAGTHDAPAPEQAAGFAATAETFLSHMLPTTRYKPDIAALSATPTRIIVAAGAASKGELANRTAVALTEALATDIVEFPGGHTGFITFPDSCARQLTSLIGDAT